MNSSPPRGLVVFAGGLRDKIDAIEPLYKRLRELPEFKDWDFYIFDEPIRPTSRGELAERSDRLRVAVAEQWEVRGKPPNVILLGHSIGGLMIRHAYLAALGGLGGPPQEWASRVSRIVLFAAPNAGVETQRYPIHLRMIIRLVLSVSHGWSAAGAIRGAPFLTNLRIAWMRVVAAMDNPPLVVQVRGDHDRAVLATDSLDLESLPNSATRELHGADHASVIQPALAWETPSGQQFEMLKSAIVGDFSANEVAAVKGLPVDAVVFLLHGIRAGITGWVENLGNILSTSTTPKVALENQSYGYLSAYKFMLPWGHDRQLRKFGDWYSRMVSLHGDVAFHFVGHSNGTYIMGRSLERVPAMTFEKVYLAGSVLPTDFPWSVYQSRQQAQELVNACGTTDIPVGMLCRALRAVGRKELGTAGYNGFEDTTIVKKQFVNVVGGHGAGLDAERLPEVAGYILAGTVPSGETWKETAPSTLFDTVAKFAGWLGRLAAAALVGGVAALALCHHWVALIAVVSVLALVLIVLSAI